MELSGEELVASKLAALTGGPIAQIRMASLTYVHTLQLFFQVMDINLVVPTGRRPLRKLLSHACVQSTVANKLVGCEDEVVVQNRRETRNGDG